MEKISKLKDDLYKNLEKYINIDNILYPDDKTELNIEVNFTTIEDTVSRLYNIIEEKAGKKTFHHEWYCYKFNLMHNNVEKYMHTIMNKFNEFVKSINNIIDEYKYKTIYIRDFSIELKESHCEMNFRISFEKV